MWAIALSAVAAGLVGIGVTLLIERYGGVIGGLLGTIPSTIVPAVLGIFWAAPRISEYRDAMSAVPVGMAIDGLFLICWRVVPPLLPGGVALRLGATTVISLSFWAGAAALGALGIEVLQEQEVPPLLVGLVAFVVLEIIGVWACRVPVPAPRGTGQVSRVVLASRGVLAALAVGTAGGLALVGSPLLAGMASVFPAVFLTTMVSLWWSQGEAVPNGAVGPMILGSGAVSAYALAAAFTLPALGSVVGSAAAWGVSVVLVTVPAWAWLRWQRGAIDG